MQSLPGAILYYYCRVYSSYTSVKYHCLTRLEARCMVIMFQWEYWISLQFVCLMETTNLVTSGHVTMVQMIAPSTGMWRHFSGSVHQHSPARHCVQCVFATDYLSCNWDPIEMDLLFISIEYLVFCFSGSDRPDQYIDKTHHVWTNDGRHPKCYAIIIFVIMDSVKVDASK